MTVRHPWVGAIVLVVAAVWLVVVAVRRRRRRRSAAPVAGAPIANVDRALESPVFVRMRRRYRRLVHTELALLATAAAACTVLLMQPVGSRAEGSSRLNRDVMLCLDVSGSMADVDSMLLDQFERLAGDLAGERIGLTIWNGSAVTLFPLTDDAAFVHATLGTARDALERNDVNFLNGTRLGGSSLIGDGLASCALRFDRLDEHRARSIVFATDNALAGSPIMTLAEAAQLARGRGVQVFALAPADQIAPGNAANLRNEVLSTGGAYFEVGDRAALASVVQEIRALQASATEQPPRHVEQDRPGPWLTLAALATAGAALAAWGLRR